MSVNNHRIGTWISLGTVIQLPELLGPLVLWSFTDGLLDSSDTTEICLASLAVNLAANWASLGLKVCIPSMEGTIWLNIPWMLEFEVNNSGQGEAAAAALTAETHQLWKDQNIYRRDASIFWSQEWSLLVQDQINKSSEQRICSPEDIFL